MLKSEVSSWWDRNLNPASRTFDLLLLAKTVLANDVPIVAFKDPPFFYFYAYGTLESTQQLEKNIICLF